MKTCANPNCEAFASKHRTECVACRKYRLRTGELRPYAVIVATGWRRWEAHQELTIVRRSGILE